MRSVGISRRRLLQSASAIAIAAALPKNANALLHGGSGSGFNGGKSQGQSGPSNSEFQFLNLAKLGTSWKGQDTLNNGATIDPSWLDTDGYPLASALSGTNGVKYTISLPPQTSFTANVKVLWDVVGAGVTDQVHMQVVTMNTTFVATNATFDGGFSFHSTGNGTDFFYTFTPLYTNPSFDFVIASLAGTAHVTNLRVVFDDGTRAQLLAQGKMFDPQFLGILQQAKFGIYRFKDLMGVDTSNVTSWSTRKSVSYISWNESEFRASLYAGPTTNSGNDYSISFSSGAPVDKQTFHLRFNADATLVQSSVTTSGVPGTVTFNWTAHPLNNGDPISINTGESGAGSQMVGTSPGTNYYVVNKTANTFQAATTVGGTAISTTNDGGNVVITRMPTLNLNSTGALPIRNVSMLPCLDVNLIPRATFSGSPVQLYGTVNFDADLQTWLLSGGTYGGFSVGLNSGWPPEVCLQLCKEVGCHAHWNIPPHALDPATDYVPSLASLCQSSGPSWFIPRFEPSNEVWNNSSIAFIGTLIAKNKGFAHWPTVENYGGNWDNWYGKVLSVMGQGLASVFGRANLGTKYEVLCGVMTNGPAAPDDRLKASAYTGQAAAPQSGYLKVAPTTPLQYVSAVAPANYVSPTMRGDLGELQNAWGYYVTNVGNPTAQAANLNAFVDTLNGASAPFNILQVVGKFNTYASWAAGFGVMKTTPYEGGYSPDLVVNTSGLGNQWQSPITGATNASPSVLTLATTNPPDAQHGTLTGNPAVAGMVLCIQGVIGATGLNCLSSDNIGGATFTAGSASISWPSNILIVNQCVVFRAGFAVPPNVTAGTTYFVISTGLSSSAFQISATKGGSAIVAGGTGTYLSAPDTGWAVTNVSGNSVTIDVSSAPGAYTSGGTAYYLGSTLMANNFRVATLLFATDLQSLMTSSYTQLAAISGFAFPSQYEMAGSGVIWPCIQPDIWGTQSGEFAAIVAFNH